MTTAHNMRARNSDISLRSTTSSTQYPRHITNGFARRMARVYKKILLQTQEAGTDCHLAKMTYRATSILHNLMPPAEMLNGQPICTPLVSKQQIGEEQMRNPDNT